MVNWGVRRVIGRLDGGWKDEAGYERETVDSRPRASWISARVTDLAAVALIVGAGLVVPAAAPVSAQAASAGVYTMTPGRMAASSAAVTALIGVVLGGRALARAGRRGTGDGRRGIIASLVLGSIGVIVGALVVATADGGLGTGGGLAGGVVAMMLGLIGLAIAGLALARSRRAA